MLEWLEALRRSSLCFWLNDGYVTSEQLAGLVVLCSFVYAFIQNLYASSKPAIEYGWSILLVLTILVFLYYLFGWLTRLISGSVFKNLHLLLRLHFVHLFLAMLILTTNYYAPWYDFDWVSEYSPWSESLMSSMAATILLFIHTLRMSLNKALMETRQKTFLIASSTYITSVTFILMSYWVIPTK